MHSVFKRLSSQLIFSFIESEFIFKHHLHIGQHKKDWCDKTGLFLVSFTNTTCLYNWFIIVFGLRRMFNLIHLICTWKHSILVFYLNPSLSAQLQPILQGVLPCVVEKWVAGVLTNFKNVISYLTTHRQLEHVSGIIALSCHLTGYL
jgi:ribosomal protein S2